MPRDSVGPHVDPVLSGTGTVDFGAPQEMLGADEVAPKKGLGLVAWLSIAWLVIVVIVAIVAPMLPLDLSTNNKPKLPPFSGGHLFGTDTSGRDVFNQVLIGTRSTLVVGFGAVLFGLIIGGFLGLIAGYFKGRITGALGSLFDILLAYPPLVLALTLVSVFANDPTVSEFRRLAVIILALGIVSVPILARITRANTLVWSEREFVTAARAMGAGRWRILFRDVLPNVVPAMLVISFLGVAVAIVAESGLAILGVGVKVSITSTSWGQIINSGRSQLSQAPYLVFAPAIVLFLTVMALNFVGDVVRARFDVKESGL
jgi:peptide/nickel transport system permease protein